MKTRGLLAFGFVLAIALLLALGVNGRFALGTALMAGAFVVSEVANICKIRL